MRRSRRPDGMPRHWLSCYVGDVLLIIPAIILFCLMMLFEKAYSGLRRTAAYLMPWPMLTTLRDRGVSFLGRFRPRTAR
jgi:hypothetical protein